jgi:hypothetical protein
MKSKILIAVWMLVGIAAFSQSYSDTRPCWVRIAPNAPKDANYFLNWGVGEADNEPDATNAAWADALQKSLHELGVVGITQQDIEDVKKNGINAVVKFNQMKRRILCTTGFSKEPNSAKGKIYVLIQVERNIHGKDDFYDVEATKVCNCNGSAIETSNDKYYRAFIPGMAQLYYGKNTKAGLFIGGEVLFLGGVVVGEVLRAQNIAKMNSTHDKKFYADRASACETVRNISIGGVVLVYVWNVIDGSVLVSKNKKLHRQQFSFLPYATPYNSGLTMTLKF